MANESVTKPLPWFLSRHVDPEMKFSLPADWDRTERQSRKDQSLPVRLHFRRLTGMPNWVGFPQIQSLGLKRGEACEMDFPLLSLFYPPGLASNFGTELHNIDLSRCVTDMSYIFNGHSHLHISQSEFFALPLSTFSVFLYHEDAK